MSVYAGPETFRTTSDGISPSEPESPYLRERQLQTAGGLDVPHRRVLGREMLPHLVAAVVVTVSLLLPSLTR